MLDTHMLPDMPDIPMDTHIPTVSMERDLLMPSQLMPTTDTTDMPDLILMDGPHTDTQLMLTERSADAEPKADAYYGSVYGYPYAAGYAYGAYPYAHGVYAYGKRSADAEPKADAYYGYYGYARPYSYGYARYGYGGYGRVWG